MMKRFGISFLALAACLTIWSMLGNQSAERHATHDQEVAELSSPSPAQQARTPESLLMSEESLVNDDRGSESCDELSRLTETTGRRVMLAPDREDDEAACARAVRWASGATISALPGLAGHGVPDISDAQPARQLAEENDDPEWSRAMENRIVSEIQRRVGFPVLSLHAVCRTTMCGLVFASPIEVQLGGNYNHIAQQLADQLGFSGYHGGRFSGRRSTAFVAIYLGDWATPRQTETLTE